MMNHYYNELVSIFEVVCMLCFTLYVYISTGTYIRIHLLLYGLHISEDFRCSCCLSRASDGCWMLCIHYRPGYNCRGVSLAQVLELSRKVCALSLSSGDYFLRH